MARTGHDPTNYLSSDEKNCITKLESLSQRYASNGKNDSPLLRTTNTEVYEATLNERELQFVRSYLERLARITNYPNYPENHSEEFPLPLSLKLTKFNEKLMFAIHRATESHRMTLLIEDAFRKSVFTMDESSFRQHKVEQLCKRLILQVVLCEFDQAVSELIETLNLEDESEDFGNQIKAILWRYRRELKDEILKIELR